MHRKGTAKLNVLRDIEILKQKQWEDAKMFESKPNNDKEKHFVTFPYPYMNGILHLGHAFSLSKCEFSMGYERLKGKNTMWGFGLHCTGMPIKSSADKLSREMNEYGFPPTFPEVTNTSKIEEIKKECGADKSKSKKAKAVAKSGGLKYQWQIMRANGMSDEEIVKFVDPKHWLQYFPPMTIDHMKQLGIKVDWRRSFITTDANPYYDSFVRWQFLRLKKANKIMFGKRETIFSPRDGQPCMDHDRSSGEGVGPQEYTLIKMKLQKPYPKILDPVNEDVFLVAATLRPETMYGQTNCWIHPDLTYVAVKSANHGVLICVERSAKNMAYQEILSNEQGSMEIISKLKGSELIGCGLVAPLSFFKIVFILPMMSIKENKGTGVVTSVPSDSPDDFAALRDLKNKPALREKYGITDDKVMPFEPVAIIHTEKYGDMCAPKCVEELDIRSQNDFEKLEIAKESCYRHGFYNGKMKIGPFAGESVQTVKDKIQTDLITRGEAIKYFEPERVVMSRSGDECVVAKCDQWYLNYHDESWKSKTRECLALVDTCSKDVRNSFETNLERLHEYACSRSYGLGTRIPWDEQYLVESLSDSTVYMAYYTVAHRLQGGTLDGVSDGNDVGIAPSAMDYDAWEYVLGDQSSVTSLSDDMRTRLDALRREFLYWYPVDLRVSGKDLVPNHLTYYLLNHVAIWPEEPAQYWPKKIRANGHLLLNNEKMSKSTGNFMTVVDAVNKYSADGMRLALADSGDSIEDANFVEDMADAGVLRLYTFLEWVKEVLAGAAKMRSGPLTMHCDRVFASSIERTITEVDGHYRDMMYRRVVQVGFHELQIARDRYRECSLNDCHVDLLTRFIEVQCLLLSPICPHMCDHIWSDVLGKATSILDASWPVAGPVDSAVLEEGAYIDRLAADFRRQSTIKQRSKNAAAVEKNTGAVIYVALGYPPWQRDILEEVAAMAADQATLPDNRDICRLDSVTRRKKKAMDFVQFVREKTDGEVARLRNLMNPDMEERCVIELNLPYMERALGLRMGALNIASSDDCNDEKLADACCPMYPRIKFLTGSLETASATLHLVNRQLFVGLFSLDVVVNNDDSAQTVVRRIADRMAINDFARISLNDGPLKIAASSKFVVTADGAVRICDRDLPYRALVYSLE